MSKKELKTGEILVRIAKGDLSQKEASLELSLSVRQIKRLNKRYKAEGISGLAHRNRGRCSSKKISPKNRLKVVELIRNNYIDFGPQLIKEQLEERNHLCFSREWIRSLMIEEGLWQVKKRKNIKVYQRRSCRSHEGELIQIDGSPHAWFEERAPKCCLINMVDDATGKIKECRFIEEESLRGYLMGMRSYIEAHGRPLAIYSDRHSIFKSSKSEEKPTLTQFGRAMKELGIKLIYANSPQAKGRVERSHSTLQDRLIKMMRLDGVSSIEAGNTYLKGFIEEYNRRFGKAPQSKENMHRNLPEEMDLNRILCRKEERKISKSLEVQYKHATYQLIAKGNSRRLMGKKAHLLECEDRIRIEVEGEEYEYKMYQEQAYEETIIDRKRIDAFLSKKKPMTGIEQHRKRKIVKI